MPSIHQVNHPGIEMNISYLVRKDHTEDYYFYNNSNSIGVRLWNRDSTHKRKFIEHKGRYIESLGQNKQREGILRFWGEYEGHSEFHLLEKNKEKPIFNQPIAVHKPFFCSKLINNQNTDPYIFDNKFYYAICKKEKLKNIKEGDIILFGSEFGKRGEVQFYLDTLFVVDAVQPSILDKSLYSKIYLESTLKRLGYSDCTKGTLPIHLGKNYSKNKIYSFFPSKLNINISFGRPIIDTVSLRLQTPGARTGSKSRELDSNENINDIWNKIASSVISQGFLLGTGLDEIPVLSRLPN